MSDDDDTTETAAATDGDGDDTSTSTARAESGRDGVSVPSWLASGLVVLLGIAIGAAGFALGRATDGDGGGRGERPIVSVRPGQDGSGIPGFPGGPGGGGPGGRGEFPFEDGGPRGLRPERDEKGSDEGDTDTDESEDDESGSEDDAEGASVFGI